MPKATGFNLPITAYLGFFYHFQDTAVTRFMFQYDLFSLGFDNDVNLSNLAPITKSVCGLESFLRFNLADGGGFRDFGKKIDAGFNYDRDLNKMIFFFWCLRSVGYPDQSNTFHHSPYEV